MARVTISARHVWRCCAFLVVAITVRAVEDSASVKESQDVLSNHLIAVDKTGSACFAIYEPGDDGNGSGRVRLVPFAGEDTSVRVCPQDKGRAPFAKYLSMLLKNAERELASRRADRILIFIHGGMNTMMGAAHRPLDLVPEMRKAGIYPIFIAWDSDIRTSYLDHLFNVRLGIRDPKFAATTSPFALVADVGGAVSSAGLDLQSLTRNDSQAVVDPRSDKGGKLTYNQLRAARYSEAARRSKLPPEVMDVSMGRDKQTTAQRVGDVASYVVTFPLKVATTPFIAAFGRAGWHNMLRGTRTMFARESRYVRVEDRVATLPPKAQSQPKVQGQPVVAFTRTEYTAQQLSNINKLAKTLKRQDDQVIYTGRQGAVEMFFVALNEQFKGRWNLPKIVLAGHSMGCIVACEALSRHPEIHYDDIVFLAAACSIAEYRRAVIPYLGQPANLTTKFYNLCLYPAVERGEKPLGKVDLIARGSLLMWIDSFLAQPESEQDRTMGRWDNCILHAGNPDIPQNVAPRVTFKAFGRGRVKDGKLIDPTEHGEFSQTTNKNLAFRFWVMSFWNAEQPGPDVIEAWPIKN